MELPSPQGTYLTWAPASPKKSVARPPRRLQNGAAAVFGLEVSQWTAGPCWADWLSGNKTAWWFGNVYSPYIWNNHPN